ncbi:hypothetical protein D3C71_2055320 [compost metagenome]
MAKKFKRLLWFLHLELLHLWEVGLLWFGHMVQQVWQTNVHQVAQQLILMFGL